MLLSIAELWVFTFVYMLNGDVNFDKLVHENMFTSIMHGVFPKTGHK